MRSEPRQRVVADKEERGGMGEWPKLRFSDAVLINPPVHLERGKSYPFVAMAAVHAGSRGAYAGEQRAYSGGGTRFRSGDTLMARITPCLENGKIARYCAPHSSDTAHGSTEFIVLRGRPAVTDSEFVYYLTHWEEVRHYAIGQMTGTSGRQRVPTPSLAHLTVTIPPLPEQRAIAYLLGTLDAKIEVNRRMNATLDEMARALFTSWFINFDPVQAKAALTQRASPGGSAGPVARAYLDRLEPALAALFPDRFVDSALGPIPAGWELQPLAECIDVARGLSYQGSKLAATGLPMHNLNSIYEGGGYKQAGIKYYAGDFKARHTTLPGEKFAENLKRELPRLPFAPDFRAFAAAGKQIARLHLEYESLEPYDLQWIEADDVPLSQRVERMKLSKDKTALVVNDSLTLAGIPPEVFAYRLGNRSALEWVIDQYRIKTDKRSGIRSDPNRLDDEAYIVRLVGQVVRLSLETVSIVAGLPAELGGMNPPRFRGIPERSGGYNPDP